ncbi:pilus assembly protein PilM [Christensenellaceae bacterium]|nr:pilus assembly protein PilM [Christensenellaceae bacterium]BDF60601.1 pilus assembly protein PilM [Christensenellaceae bacterium]
MLSIDIGSKFLKIIQGNGDRSIKTKKEVLSEMPENCVHNGVVTDFEQVAKTIQNVLAEERITDKKAVVTMSSPDIVVRELTLPKTTPKNTRQMVESELEDFLAGERYAIDYLTRADAEHTRVLVFGIDQKLADGYKAMLVSAGLTPVALDVHANAVRKLACVAEVVPNTDHEVSIVTDIGFDLINFHFFIGGELTFTRCAVIGMDAYAKENIGQMYGRSAEELKDDVNFNTYVASLGDEIQKMLQFAATGEYKSLETRIYLAGGGARFEGLAELLGEYLSRGVTALNTKILLNALGAQIRV